MKKSLTVFVFFMMLFNSIQSQISTILPCNAENYERDAIKMNLVFDENGHLVENTITSLPQYITCDSKYYAHITVHNQSSKEIEIIQIENLLFSNETSNTTMGGIDPIIIRPVPIGCIRAISLDPIDFSLLQRMATTTPQITFAINDKFGNTLTTIQKEFEYAGNKGELEITRATATMHGKIDIQWDITNSGCALKTSFSSNIYTSTDNILDKNDTLIATRNTLLSSNTASEHLAILNSSIHQQQNKFIIIKVDSKNDIIENNESNNTVSIEVSKNKAPLVYPQPVINIVNFTFETKKNTPAIIYIFDQSGVLKKIKKYKFKKDKSTCVIDLSQFKSGLYFYKMVVRNASYFGKLIKK